jgi:hypothetical protein
VPQAGAVICHLVRFALDVLEDGKVTMVTLVESLKPEKVRRDTSSRCGALGLPGQGRGIIRQGSNGAFANVSMVGKHVMVGNGASQLQV